MQVKRAGDVHSPGLVTGATDLLLTGRFQVRVLARELAGPYIVSLSPATAQEERESPWRSKRPRGAVSPQNPHKQSAAAKTCRFDQARPHPAARSGQRGLETKDDPATPAAGRQAAVRLGGPPGG